MADEYIKRDLVIELLEEKQRAICPAGRCGRGYVYGRDRDEYDAIESDIDAVQNIPSEDVSPVARGRWLSKEYMYGDPDIGLEDMWVDRIAEHSDYYAYCSECGKDAGYNGDGELILSAYCHNCGAKMDLE